MDIYGLFWGITGLKYVYLPFISRLRNIYLGPSLNCGFFSLVFPPFPRGGIKGYTLFNLFKSHYPGIYPKIANKCPSWCMYHMNVICTCFNRVHSYIIWYLYLLYKSTMQFEPLSKLFPQSPYQANDTYTVFPSLRPK
jgi:hypothetical protein